MDLFDTSQAEIKGGEAPAILRFGMEAVSVAFGLSLIAVAKGGKTQAEQDRLVRNLQAILTEEVKAMLVVTPICKAKNDKGRYVFVGAAFVGRGADINVEDDPEHAIVHALVTNDQHDYNTAIGLLQHTRKILHADDNFKTVSARVSGPFMKAIGPYGWRGVLLADFSYKITATCSPTVKKAAT